MGGTSSESGVGAEVRVATPLYVDENAVQFYKDCLERDLRRGFQRAVLLPIGLVSVALLVLLVFYWIPLQIPSLVQESEAVRTRVTEATSEYLRSPDTGQELIRSQVEAVVRTDAQLSRLVEEATARTLDESQALRNHLETVAATAARDSLDGARERFFASDPGRALLSESMRRALDAYFESEAGAEVIGAAITRRLEGEEFQAFLGDAVNRALSPARAR